MTELNIKVNLTDEQIDWLDGDEDVLFHCCGSGGSASKTNTQLQELFANAIKESIENCLEIENGKETV